MRPINFLKNNRERFAFVVTIITSLTLFSYLLPKDSISFFIKHQALVFSVFGTIIIMVGTGGYLLYYLDSYKLRDDLNPFYKENPLKDIVQKAKEMNLELSALKAKNYQNDDSVDINSEIDNYLKTRLTETDILEKLHGLYGESAMILESIKMIDLEIKKLTIRLDAEISRLRANANVNLAFGSVITSAALAFLAFEIYRSEIKFQDLPALLTHFIPRISIVIFIELFAFFFLKIYKSNLTDIKYFHNEMTNIEAKNIALKTSIFLKSGGSHEIILEFSKTERNFILRKDESTIEIEKEKIDGSNVKSIMDTLKDIVKK